MPIKFWRETNGKDDFMSRFQLNFSKSIPFVTSLKQNCCVKPKNDNIKRLRMNYWLIPAETAASRYHDWMNTTNQYHRSWISWIILRKFCRLKTNMVRFGVLTQPISCFASNMQSLRQWDSPTATILLILVTSNFDYINLMWSTIQITARVNYSSTPVDIYPSSF